MIRHGAAYHLARRARQRYGHKRKLPPVVLQEPLLGAPEAIHHTVWQPLPGSHLWGGDLLSYFAYHLKAGARAGLLMVAACTVLAAIMLAPLWVQALAHAV